MVASDRYHFFGDFMINDFNRIIGYVGFGPVGKSCHSVFKNNCESIIVDPKSSEITLSQMIDKNPGLVFVSLPAPTLASGRVDYSLVFQTLLDLSEKKFPGIVVVKSTLTPDIVVEMFNQFESRIKLVFSPEFITEKNWKSDAQFPDQIILSGHYAACDTLKYIYIWHSNVDRAESRIRITHYFDAAMAKYAINCFLALKVSFFNQIYDIYKEKLQSFDEYTWQEFSSLVSADKRIGTSHISVPGPDGHFGYGGRCFPKDVKAFIEYAGQDTLPILKEAEIYNLKRRMQG